jgi:hypothetical protein
VFEWRGEHRTVDHRGNECGADQRRERRTVGTGVGSSPCVHGR